MLRVIEDLGGGSALHDDDIFEAVLTIVISGLCERAPRPCTCGAHPGGAAAE